MIIPSESLEPYKHLMCVELVEVVLPSSSPFNLSNQGVRAQQICLLACSAKPIKLTSKFDRAFMQRSSDDVIYLILEYSIWY